MHLPPVDQSEFQSKVFIHIRGGDYLENTVNREFYGTTNQTYYQQSLRHVLSENEKQQFILFTNDMNLSEEYLGSQMDNITIDESQNSLEALAKMRACSGAIMANSSFSWWGAFLQKNKGIQIAPKKWNSKMEPKKAFIYPPYVIRF